MDCGNTTSILFGTGGDGSMSDEAGLILLATGLHRSAMKAAKGPGSRLVSKTATGPGAPLRGPPWIRDGVK